MLALRIKPGRPIPVTPFSLSARAAALAGVVPIYRLLRGKFRDRIRILAAIANLVLRKLAYLVCLASRHVRWASGRVIMLRQLPFRDSSGGRIGLDRHF